MGKNLLVIGASSDMAMGTIRQIHGDYDRVLAHYRRMNDTLAQLKEELGDKLMLLQADLADEYAVPQLIEEIRASETVPSHILHFPGVPIQTRKFHKTPWKVFEDAFNVSVRSAVQVLQAFLPEMAKNGGGRVILMLSMVVNGMPPKYNADYVMTKYAQLGLVKALAVEYADKGITVNGVSPSVVETAFLANLHEYVIEQNAKQSPTGRNLQVKDVVPTIQYLLSPGAAAINGQNISITEGR